MEPSRRDRGDPAAQLSGEDQRTTGEVMISACDVFRSQMGVALVTAIVLLVVLLGLTMTYSSLSFSSFESSNRESATIRARMAAKEGIYLSIAELKTDVDTGGDGLGVVSFAGQDERAIQTEVEDLGGGMWRIRSVGAIRRAEIAMQAFVFIEPAWVLDFNPRGAVAARGAVRTLGGISIDGRDWDYNGTTITGPGTFGISSEGGINIGGSSTVGGTGLAPSSPPPPGAIEPNASWANGADDDGDGRIDEEPYDGRDNDGDGAVDEDISGYPESPDAVLGVAPGTLQELAQRAGTYFTSSQQLNDYIAANGGNMPGGKVIYLAFQTWQPADVGPALNDPPSIIVHHTPSGDALMKNVHGAFRGIVFADFIEHLNGDFNILGALMSFANEAYGNAFGNGNASVQLSTAVTGNLIDLGTLEKKATVLSWSWAPAWSGPAQ